MKLFLTPPVLTVLFAPLPLAGVVLAVRDGSDSLAILGIGWMFALFSTVLWLVFVVPIITFYGQLKNGKFTWPRVLISGWMGGFCVGVLFAPVWALFAPASVGNFAEHDFLTWGFVHSYVALIASFFLMCDPFFRHGGGKV